MPRRRLGFVGLAVLLAGCSAVLGIHDPEIERSGGLSTEEDEAGTDETPNGRDANFEGSAPSGDDASVDAGPDAPNEPPLTKMVTVPSPGGGTFQIDATEVTQAQYAVFLARGTATVKQIPECASNAIFAPSLNFDPVKTPNRPVVNVDWCDAAAYCTFAGKRLCGGLGGVPGAYADLTNPAKNEWMAACTKAGAAAFPYGVTEQPGACNIHSADAGALVDVGSRATCEGGYAGVFDLVGNTTEWVDHCDPAMGCGILGGSFRFPNTGSVNCGFATATGRGGAFDDLSFRCCK